MKLALPVVSILCGISIAFPAAFAQLPCVSGTVVVPSSSVEKPEDIGSRSHTNLLLYELREPLGPPLLLRAPSYPSWLRNSNTPGYRRRNRQPPQCKIVA